MTDMLTCELVSSSNSMRSQTVSATRSSTASNSSRLGSRSVIVSGGVGSGMLGWNSGGTRGRERPQALERLADVQRQFGSEVEPSPRSRVQELQFGGMQSLPPEEAQQRVREATLGLPEAQHLFDASAIGGVPDHGMPERGQVHADLMGPAGFEPRLEPGREPIALQHLPARPGRLSPRTPDHRHPLAVFGIAPDG